MCNFKSVNNNKNGYVMRCPGCGHIQVAFGNIILSLNPGEYHELIRNVHEQYNCNRQHPFPEQKIIRIATAARAVMLAFSLNETRDLMELLTDGSNKPVQESLFSFNYN